MTELLNVLNIVDKLHIVDDHGYAYIWNNDKKLWEYKHFEETKIYIYLELKKKIDVRLHSQQFELIFEGVINEVSDSEFVQLLDQSNSNGDIPIQNGLIYNIYTSKIRPRNTSDLYTKELPLKYNDDDFMYKGYDNFCQRFFLDKEIGKKMLKSILLGYYDKPIVYLVENEIQLTIFKILLQDILGSYFSLLKGYNHFSYQQVFHNKKCVCFDTLLTGNVIHNELFVQIFENSKPFPLRLPFHKKEIPVFFHTKIIARKSKKLHITKNDEFVKILELNNNENELNQLLNDVFKLKGNGFLNFLTADKVKEIVEEKDETINEIFEKENDESINDDNNEIFAEKKNEAINDNEIFEEEEKKRSSSSSQKTTTERFQSTLNGLMILSSAAATSSKKKRNLQEKLLIISAFVIVQHILINKNNFFNFCDLLQLFHSYIKRIKKTKNRAKNPKLFQVT